MKHTAKHPDPVGSTWWMVEFCFSGPGFRRASERVSSMVGGSFIFLATFGYVQESVCAVGPKCLSRGG